MNGFKAVEKAREFCLDMDEKTYDRFASAFHKALMNRMLASGMTREQLEVASDEAFDEAVSSMDRAA